MTLLSFRHLIPSVREHQLVEAKVFHILGEIIENGYLSPLKHQVNPLRYAQRHFFSILFLAIYRALGVPFERRLFYGVINHAIRGIVTGTDNLLDEEYKEILPLRFPEQATRFKSVMHILLADRVLFRVVEEAASAGDLPGCRRDLIQQKIFEAMVPIGAEEASEEGGVREIVPPAVVLQSIHAQKGGNLLRLAFVAPRLVEAELFGPLEIADRGIYRIGLALQVIDDLTDLHEDVRARRHNYLVSSIYHEGTPTEKEALRQLMEHPNESEGLAQILFAESVRRVMQKAIGEALAGFSALEEAGFWLTGQDAQRLIRYLFRLRGVGSLLALWPADNRFTRTLEVPGGA